MEQTSHPVTDRPIYQFLAWLLHHPVVFASVVIFITSIVGYVYESSLFSGFDINIFRFSSVYDFMYQWWRQWVVVSHFLVIMTMVLVMVAGYFLSALVTDTLAKYRADSGKPAVRDIILPASNISTVRSTLIFFINLLILAGTAYLLVTKNQDILAGQQIYSGVIYAGIYGCSSFFAVWVIRCLVIKNCQVQLWKWTGISLLIAGVLYLFIIMLVNISHLAKTESRLIRGDTKYTYTVIRSSEGRDIVVSRDAKILAITTYYHIFYKRESGKVEAVSNQYIASIESNWVR